MITVGFDMRNEVVKVHRPHQKSSHIATLNGNQRASLQDMLWIMVVEAANTGSAARLEACTEWPVSCQELINGQVMNHEAFGH